MSELNIKLSTLREQNSALAQQISTRVKSLVQTNQILRDKLAQEMQKRAHAETMVAELQKRNKELHQK